MTMMMVMVIITVCPLTGQRHLCWKFCTFFFVLFKISEFFFPFRKSFVYFENRSWDKRRITRSCSEIIMLTGFWFVLYSIARFLMALSFRGQFDLVCDRKLLGALAQSFVIMGQGIGAVLSAMVSDRWSRPVEIDTLTPWCPRFHFALT